MAERPRDEKDEQDRKARDQAARNPDAQDDGDLRRSEIGDRDRDDALFVNLVLIFQTAAMQQMGKTANPLTGKVERNLEQARFSIDVLSMLREKTRGNLSSDIERLLDSTLLNLRMNYVEEVSADEKAKGEGK